MTESKTDRLRVGLVYNLKRTVAKAEGDDDRDAEFDAPKTIEALVHAIEAAGHDVVHIEADVGFLRRVGEVEIDLAFNIAEGLHGRSRESLVPAVLDLLQIEYTGSDAATLAVTLDKSLARAVVSQAGIPVAPGRVMLDPKGALAPDMDFPLIVKPVAEGSSKGVTGASVVHDRAGLEAAIEAVMQRYRQGALVEGFLPGREFTVGLVGGPVPRVLTPLEIVFDGSDAHPVYSFGHKIEVDFTARIVAAELSPEQDAELRQMAVDAFVALGCRDVARIDFRCDAQGRPRFIECNPLPGLTPGWSDLCVAANFSGMDYAGLIAAILEPAVRRVKERA